MTDNILASIKTGKIAEQASEFDEELILYINSVFSVLTQLGVGPDTGFSIQTGEETWSDFLGDSNNSDLEFVKIYMKTRVMLMFDPPNNSFLIDSMKKICDEFEWRLNVEVETPAHVEPE